MESGREDESLELKLNSGRYGIPASPPYKVSSMSILFKSLIPSMPTFQVLDEDLGAMMEAQSQTSGSLQ